MLNRVSFYIGIILILASAYPSFLVCRELYLDKVAKGRYKIEKLEELKGVNIELEGSSLIGLKVNGEDYSPNIPANIYGVFSLLDNEISHSYNAIIHNVPQKTYQGMKYRIILIDESKNVTEEKFKLDERATPLYRTSLIKRVHPSLIGYRSNILSGWATIFFPLIYPVVSLFVGLVLSTVTGWKIFKSPKSAL